MDEVTIVAPYDSSVTSTVLPETVEVWKALGWKVKDEAPAPATSTSAPSSSAPGKTSPSQI